ncbi:hypothetical protein QVD17_25557 [Tagetes erecta]|uniref:Uncharacterized protein n=1 Tax=Tagetes erecta TaxID=13708 RepID=A0AAD8KGU2_TARER|nr:hypothetical protein QVD17_25557 [Tagetes erecta]
MEKFSFIFLQSDNFLIFHDSCLFVDKTNIKLVNENKSIPYRVKIVETFPLPTNVGYDELKAFLYSVRMKKVKKCFG